MMLRDAPGWVYRLSAALSIPFLDNPAISQRNGMSEVAGTRYLLLP